eukprot:PhM_4_TR15690/c2_g8_i2/m.54427
MGNCKSTKTNQQLTRDPPPQQQQHPTTTTTTANNTNNNKNTMAQFEAAALTARQRKQLQRRTEQGVGDLIMYLRNYCHETQNDILDLERELYNVNDQIEVLERQHKEQQDLVDHINWVRNSIQLIEPEQQWHHQLNAYRRREVVALTLAHQRHRKIVEMNVRLATFRVVRHVCRTSPNRETALSHPVVAAYVQGRSLNVEALTSTLSSERELHDVRYLTQRLIAASPDEREVERIYQDARTEYNLSDSAMLLLHHAHYNGMNQSLNVPPFGATESFPVDLSHIDELRCSQCGHMKSDGPFCSVTGELH